MFPTDEKVSSDDQQPSASSSTSQNGPKEIMNMIFRKTDEVFQLAKFILDNHSDELEASTVEYLRNVVLNLPRTENGVKQCRLGITSTEVELASASTEEEEEEAQIQGEDEAQDAEIPEAPVERLSILGRATKMAVGMAGVVTGLMAPYNPHFTFTSTLAPAAPAQPQPVPAAIMPRSNELRRRYAMDGSGNPDDFDDTRPLCYTKKQVRQAEGSEPQSSGDANAQPGPSGSQPAPLVRRSSRSIVVKQREEALAAGPSRPRGCMSRGKKAAGSSVKKVKFDKTAGKRTRDEDEEEEELREEEPAKMTKKLAKRRKAVQPVKEEPTEEGEGEQQQQASGSREPAEASKPLRKRSSGGRRKKAN